jgi:3-oxoacyl-(acyl-carrier-protein) synthase
MDKLVVIAANRVNGADAREARLGPRFSRLDLQSQLAVLAVEPLAKYFEGMARERIAICLEARAGSLATDFEFWKGRDAPGGPSPTIFTYTLPSAAIGEIAIRHRLTGPNLCFVGGGGGLVVEASDLIRSGEADGCLCISCNVVTKAISELTGLPEAAGACALFLRRNGEGFHLPPEIDRDMESLCVRVCGQKSVD